MSRLPSVTQAALYPGVVQEVYTSGYVCFLLKGAQCFSRLDRAAQVLMPHSKFSSYQNNHSSECRLHMVKTAPWGFFFR